MKRGINILSIIITIIGIWIIFGNAQDANTVLKKVSDILNAPQDQTLTESVEIIESDGSVRERVLEIQQKGDDLRLVRFTEPAEVAGVSFLSRGEDRLYLYLPAFRKVRRIASHAKKENFMGTDFSYEDLSETNYDQKYNAAFLEEDETSWNLKLTPKPGANAVYSSAVMRVDKQTNYPLSMDLFEESERPVKRLELSDIRERGGYLMAGSMKMTTLSDNHQTVIRLEDVKFDQGLSDRLFTERNLKRWRP